MSDADAPSSDDAPEVIRPRFLGGSLTPARPGRPRLSAGDTAAPAGGGEDDQAVDDAAGIGAEDVEDGEVASEADSDPATPDPAPEPNPDPPDQPDFDSDWNTQAGTALPRRIDRQSAKVLGIAVAVVVGVSLLVAALSLGRSSSPKETTGTAGEVTMPTGNTGPAAEVPATPEDGPLPIVVDARCDGQTDPKLAASDDARSAWVCPTQGLPFGQKLTVTLSKPYVITGLKLWPGFQGKGPDGGDEWFRHRVMDEGQAVFNDPDRSLVPLTPRGDRREYFVPINHVVASALEITFLASSVPPPPAGPGAGGDPDDETAPTALFPAPQTSDEQTNDPAGASVSLWGLKVIGHPV